MRTRIEIGDNKTGFARAPELKAAMMAGVEEFAPHDTSGGTTTNDLSSITSVHALYAAESDILGTLPPVQDEATMDEATLRFMDKLGARLAFERTGTRLWEAVLERYDIEGSFEGGPSREELQQIRDEELEHFQLLTEVIERLGGDALATTPSADFEAVVGQGIGSALGDPRISLEQALQAILVAELQDNDAWESLVDIADARGESSLWNLFERALSQETEHLTKVRRWIAAAEGRVMAASSDTANG